MTNNRGILIVIAVLLFGIFAALVINYTKPPREDGIGGSVNEVVEEIGDEIDDHTTGR